MVKLVDMPDLGSGAARRVGSSPIIRTKKAISCNKKIAFFLFLLPTKMKVFICRNEKTADLSKSGFLI
jgi:hypothetical protein